MVFFIDFTITNSTARAFKRLGVTIVKGSEALTQDWDSLKLKPVVLVAPGTEFSTFKLFFESKNIEAVEVNREYQPPSIEAPNAHPVNSPLVIVFCEHNWFKFRLRALLKALEAQGTFKLADWNDKKNRHNWHFIEGNGHKEHMIMIAPESNVDLVQEWAYNSGVCKTYCVVKP